MSKGSEALEKLCEMATYLGGNDIEIRASNYNYCILRELKALEIIKNKGVNVRQFLWVNPQTDYDFYHKYHDNIMNGMTTEELTEVEFNLLKEVLL